MNGSGSRTESLEVVFPAYFLRKDYGGVVLGVTSYRSPITCSIEAGSHLGATTAGEEGQGEASVLAGPCPIESFSGDFQK